MDSEQPRVNVTRSATAIGELDGIWQWNARQYGVAHADKYLRFRTEHIDELADNDSRGKIVQRRPDLRYVLIRRRPSGPGHIAGTRLTMLTKFIPTR